MGCRILFLTGATMNKKALSIVVAFLLFSTIIIHIDIAKATENEFTYLYGDTGENYYDSPQEMWEIDNNYMAVVALSSKYLTIVDISNAETNISIVSTFYLGSNQPRKLDVSEDKNYIFVNCYEKLKIINITDVENPSLEGEVAEAGAYYIGCSYVDSTGICFCTDYTNDYITSFNCSDLTNPFKISSVSFGNEPHGIYANENVVFALGHKSSSIATFDVSDPSSMSQLDSYSHSNLYRCSTVYGEKDPYIYVGSLGTAGVSGAFYIFDISDPSNIDVLSLKTFSGVQGCSAIPNDNETRLYFNVRDNSGHNSKLYAYDITDKTNPTLLDMIQGSDSGVDFEAGLAGGMVVNRNYVFCGDGDPPVGGTDHRGIRVFRFGNYVPVPDEDQGTYRITSISDQTNNTMISDPNVYIVGTTNSKTVGQYHIQIANTTAFTNPFFNISDISETTYPAQLSENSTHYNFTIPSGIESYGAGFGTHYYRYRLKYKIVSE